MRTILDLIIVVNISCLLFLTLPNRLLGNSPLVGVHHKIQSVYSWLGFMPGYEMFLGRKYVYFEKEYCVKYWGEWQNEKGEKEFPLLASFPQECEKPIHRRMYSNRELMHVVPRVFKYVPGVSNHEDEISYFKNYPGIDQVLRVYCKDLRLQYIHVTISMKLWNQADASTSVYNDRAMGITCSSQWAEEGFAFRVKENDRFLFDEE